MKKVLITGGLGFIGSRLAKMLVDHHYKVTILDNLSPQIHGENAPIDAYLSEHTNVIIGDVRNTEDWRTALVDQDVVVHLAAETGTGQSMYEIAKYVEVNITGTAHLLDYLTNEQHHVSKVIIASSRAIYGEGTYVCDTHGLVYPEQRPDERMAKGLFEPICPQCGTEVSLQATAEAAKIHPTSIYGITKQNQEQMVLVSCASLGIPAVAYRYQNVYGPGQSLSNPYTGILSIFSTIIKNGNQINIFEDGEESRDFVYIDDVVTATFKGIENETLTSEVFNVGSGVATSVNEVAQTLVQAYGTDTKVTVTGNYRLGDIRHNYADLTNIQAKLGFEPKYTFAQGIAAFVDWVNEQEVKEDRYESSIAEMKAKGLYK
ncbi:MAG: NAD-dependent epimerase/dehydratase family protein [Culicoidibacterales bacterium]